MNAQTCSLTIDSSAGDVRDDARAGGELRLVPKSPKADLPASGAIVDSPNSATGAAPARAAWIYIR